MTEQQLDEQVEDISVYARVSPEDKIRIVKAWQRRNQVVAMTGDGVNDAPALKAADIGCAMGIAGTDVAKGAADMTLTDDNFATIVEAVRQGRGIYANIRKCVGFLLGTNIGELLSVFVSMLLFRVSPFLSMQLLWINLVTDSLPAIALGMQPIEDGVMRQKPKRKDEGIFAGGLGVQVVLQGLMFGGLALAGFALGRALDGTLEGGRTLAFMVMALTQVFHAFNMRSGRSLFAIGPFTNKYLTVSYTHLDVYTRQPYYDVRDAHILQKYYKTIAFRVEIWYNIFERYYAIVRCCARNWDAEGGCLCECALCA